MQDKRELIFEATLKLLKDGNNISNIKVNDIAVVAGIGKGTVYEYFRSKDEVFAQSIIYFIKMQKETVINSFGDKDFKTEFINVLDKIVSIINSNRLLFCTLFFNGQFYKFDSKLEREINLGMEQVKKDIMSMLRKLVERGQNEHIISMNIEEKDLSFAFLSVNCCLNHYDGIAKNCFNKYMDYNEMKEFCYNKFVKLLS